MRTDEITRMIRRAVADEKKTQRLANALAETARQRHAKLTTEERDGVVEFVRNYVEHVPLLLQDGANAAQAVGVGAEMAQLIAELEAYWFEPNDLMPDHLGLIGLMDDAYTSLTLLQAMSDWCAATAGRPLLEQSLAAVNQQMRQLIGDPVVSIIDQRVGATIASAMMQRILGPIGRTGFAFQTAPPDPIYGNTSIHDIATARLGALGVV